jgi:hypothetical protein
MQYSEAIEKIMPLVNDCDKITPFIVRNWQELT